MIRELNSVLTFRPQTNNGFGIQTCPDAQFFGLSSPGKVLPVQLVQERARGSPFHTGTLHVHYRYITLWIIISSKHVICV